MKKIVQLLLIVGVIFTLSACGNKDETKEKESSQTYPVIVEDVVKGDLSAEKTIYGQVSPIKQTPIMLQSPGNIEELKVENGSKVAKNDTIAVVQTATGNQTITAPEKGMLAKLPSTSGEFVTNEEPFAVIIDMSEVKVQMQVSQKINKLFKKDNDVSVYIDGDKYIGKILALDPMTNDQGQYLVDVRVVNKDNKILPQSMAKVIVSEVLKKDALIIPTESIVNANDESFVYTIEDNKAKKVLVEVLETQTDKSAVKADLKDNEQVITEGQLTLSDGAKVEIQKDGNAS